MFLLVRCEEPRINHASNSTCNDNTLRLLVLVRRRLYWRLQVTSSFLTLGLHFEGFFLREVYFEGPHVFEGHGRLQSWTLMIITHRLRGIYSIFPNSIKGKPDRQMSTCHWLDLGTTRVFQHSPPDTVLMSSWMPCILCMYKVNLWWDSDQVPKIQSNLPFKFCPACSCWAVN